MVFLRSNKKDKKSFEKFLKVQKNDKQVDAQWKVHVYRAIKKPPFLPSTP